MNSSPTVLSAALAGAFSGLAWPWIWPMSTLWVMLGTVLLVALPAHAFVVGFGLPQRADPARLDTALLARVGVWLVCAAAAAFIVSQVRSSM